jgi:hypothetical protein
MVRQVTDVFFVKRNHGRWQEKNRMIIDVAVAEKTPTARLQWKQKSKDAHVKRDCTNRPLGHKSTCPVLAFHQFSFTVNHAPHHHYFSFSLNIPDVHGF